jgi:hypothetical protein
MMLLVTKFLQRPVASSWIQMSFSLPRSRTPAVLPHLISETSFTPIQNQRQNYNFVCSERQEQK